MCGPLLRRFLGRHLMLCLGLGIVLVMSLAALCAPLLAPYDPNALHLDHILEPPSSMFWLGTDRLGRDVFSRLLYGGQISLWVGFVAVGISVSIGTGLGLISGYFGGLVDEGIMRGVDIMLCFPSFFLILSVIAFLEPSLTNIMIVIGLTSWMGVARLVRAETLSLRLERHAENTRKVVEFLVKHPMVESVSHPSLPDHPDHALYEKYFPNGGASIFTFRIKGGREEAFQFIDSLKIFSLLANVADVKSLVIHPASTTHAQLTDEELANVGIYQNTIRLSIGTEHIDDILADLDQALNAVK